MGVITNMGELTGFDYKSKESKNFLLCFSESFGNKRNYCSRKNQNKITNTEQS